MTEQQFDVFLAHSSRDKPLIRKIYEKLLAKGMRPWLDEEEIAPGTRFQDQIQQAIGCIKTAAIFFGQGGLGRWQALELQSLINQCIERNIPIIPVLLPGVDEIPKELLFVREFHAVLFQDGIEDSRAFFSLEWGITGKKPTSQDDTLIVPSESNIDPNTSDRSPLAEALDSLSSEKGVDYRCLRDLLKAGQWREADEETERLMVEVVGHIDDESFIPGEKFLDFPCLDLQTIDGLWVKYSNGIWGFSVQKRIYVECGANLDGKYPGDTIWNEFCHRIGWQRNGAYVRYSEFCFDLDDASPGELPVNSSRRIASVLAGLGTQVALCCLFFRLEACEL